MFWNILKKMPSLEEWKKQSANWTIHQALLVAWLTKEPLLFLQASILTHQLYIGNLVIWRLHSLILVVPLVVRTCRNEQSRF